jgi:hypothetical protein
MAEGVGFEPTVGLLLLLISSQVPLTTQPPFLNRRTYFSRIQARGKLIRRQVKCVRVQIFNTPSRLLLLSGFKGALDPHPGFGRQRLLRLLFTVAMLRRDPQKLNLPAITQAPDAKRQMDPKPDPLHPRQGAVKRLGLQADGLAAIGRKRADSFEEPVHG